METYTIFGQFQIDAPKGLDPMNDYAYTYVSSDGMTVVGIEFMSQERYEGQMEIDKNDYIEQEPITSSGGQQFRVYHLQEKKGIGYTGFGKIGDKYMCIFVLGGDYNKFATITKSFRKI
jgi:hypothetical protein